MITHLNFKISVFLFALAALQFDLLHEQSLPVLCIFLVMSIGTSHGALDHLKGRKVSDALTNRIDRSVLRGVYRTCRNHVFCLGSGRFSAFWRLQPITLAKRTPNSPFPRKDLPTKFFFSLRAQPSLLHHFFCIARKHSISFSSST